MGVTITHPLPRGTIVQFYRRGRRCKNEPLQVITSSSIANFSKPEGSSIYWYHMANQMVLQEGEILAVLST